MNLFITAKKWRFLLIFITFLIVIIGPLIYFLCDYDNLASLVTAIITAFSVFIIIFQLNYEFNKRDKEKFTRLIAILYELNLIIIRCEGYLKKWEIGKKHYNKIKIHDFHTQLSQAQIVDIDPEVYNNLQLLYYASEVILDNLEKSEIINQIEGTIDSKKILNAQIYWLKNGELEPIQLKNIKKGEITLSDIDSNRYSIAISFIKYYLRDMYRKYNLVFKVVKRYGKEQGFKFPDNLKNYSQDYVNCNIEKYKLEDGKLNSH